MLQLPLPIGGLAILLAGWSNANDNKFEKKGSKIDWDNADHFCTIFQFTVKSSGGKFNGHTCNL